MADEILLPVQFQSPIQPGFDEKALRAIDRGVRGADEVVVLSDPNNPEAMPAVLDAAPTGGEYGLAVRVISDPQDPLPVQHTSNMDLSPTNSSTIALSAGGLFTGTFVQITNYAKIAVLLNSDSLAATGALTFEFSTDGVNIDRSVSVDMVVGGDYSSMPCEGRFVRIKVRAGGAAQTYMRLQTHLCHAPSSIKFAPLIDAVTDASGAQLVKSVIVGKTTGAGGGYVPVKVNPSGAMTADISGTVSVSNFPAVQAVSVPNGVVAKGAGTYVPVSGVSGSVAIPNGAWIISVQATSSTSGGATITGIPNQIGTIQLPGSTSKTTSKTLTMPLGTCIASGTTITFTNTDSYDVEYLIV